MCCRITTGLISGCSRPQFSGKVLLHRQYWRAGRQQCHCWWQWVTNFSCDWHFSQLLNVKVKERTRTLIAKALQLVMGTHYYMEELNHRFNHRTQHRRFRCQWKWCYHQEQVKCLSVRFYVALTQWTHSTVINQVLMIIFWLWLFSWLILYTGWLLGYQQGEEHFVRR